MAYPPIIALLYDGREGVPMVYVDLDQRLVNALLGDGRTGLRDLAETLEVSVTAVSTHLAELEEGGYIRGYVPLIDYGAFGYDVTAITHLKVEGSALPAIAEELSGHDQFLGVYEVTGDHDVLVVGKYEDTDDVNRHIKRLLANPHVEASRTSVVLDPVLEFGQFELPVEEE